MGSATGNRERLNSIGQACTDGIDSGIGMAWAAFDTVYSANEVIEKSAKFVSQTEKVNELTSKRSLNGEPSEPDRETVASQ